MPPSLRFFGEIGLQNALRGDRVQPRLEARPACAGGAQRALRIVRGETFVDELGGQAKTASEAVRETAREASHRMLGAIGVGREADHQQHRPPFRDELLYGGEARFIVRRSDGRQRMGKPGFEIANGDADAPGAEVKRQDRPGSRVMGDG